MIEVGSLLRMWGNHSTWIALDEIADSVLVVSQKHTIRCGRASLLLR